MSQWQVVSFPAWQGQRYVGLAEILVRLDGFGLEIEWRCFVDEMAPEPGGKRLADLEPGTRLETLALLALVAPDQQVIDGRFEGYRHDGVLAARIRAVGGADWDVEAAEIEVLQQLASCYAGAQGPVRPEDLGS
jgi:hypothetical protein